MLDETYEMTPAEKDVANLWQAGNSAGQIAAKTGRSRSAIVGVVKRLRDKGISMRSGLKVSHQRSQKTEAFSAPPPAQPSDEAEERPARSDQFADFNFKSIPFLDRVHEMRAKDQVDIPFDGTSRTRCQWPGWPLDQKTGTMCGAQVQSAFSSIPYCSFHYRCAYHPPVKRR